MNVLTKMIRRDKDPFGNEPVTIVCLGDSVTLGSFAVGIDAQGGSGDTKPAWAYPRKLQDELWALFPHAAANVINSGIGGDDSSGMLERFGRDVARHDPDLTIIAFSQNDCYSIGDALERDIAAVTENYRRMFLRTLEIGSECMLLTPCMMCRYVSPSLVDRGVRELAQAMANAQNAGYTDMFLAPVQAMAQKMHIPIADAYKTWKHYDALGIDTTELLANGINHPAPQMHAIFVSRILEQIFADAQSV